MRQDLPRRSGAFKRRQRNAHLPGLWHQAGAPVYRELVKETQGSHTNDYTKLANIIFDKETDTIRIENQVYDADVDVDKYCQLAEELYLKF